MQQNELENIIRDIRESGHIRTPGVYWHGTKRAKDDMLKVVLYTSEYDEPLEDWLDDLFEGRN